MRESLETAVQTLVCFKAFYSYVSLFLMNKKCFVRIAFSGFRIEKIEGDIKVVYNIKRQNERRHFYEHKRQQKQ